MAYFALRSLNRIEAFEMWTPILLGQIVLITNNEVLQRAGVLRQLLDLVKQRKVLYLGHIMRGSKYALLKLIRHSKIEGRRGLGGKTHSWLVNIRD